jgi:hypothetical protein
LTVPVGVVRRRPSGVRCADGGDSPQRTGHERLGSNWRYRHSTSPGCPWTASAAMSRSGSTSR